MVRVLNKVVKQRRVELRTELGEQSGAAHVVALRRELIELEKHLYFDVQVIDPYEEVKYLGVWVQPAMYTERAAAEATKQAEAVAGALAAASIESWRPHRWQGALEGRGCAIHSSALSSCRRRCQD